MFNTSVKRSVAIIIISFVATIANAQKVNEPKPGSQDWIKPYQPFRIAGNLYYVGTNDLACYLIVTSKGNILINTGLASSAKQIENNIMKLGFRFSDIKILLTTQAHYDHMGAMAFIKKKTGAKFMVDEGDAQVSKDGGNSDYVFGGEGYIYAPVIPDRVLKNNDTVSLGEMKIVMLHHPGHTKGSCSYLFTVSDKQRSYKVLIANMPTIVTDKPFNAISQYSNIAQDYAYTFDAMQKLHFDIWLASHASQFNLHTKHHPGDAYNPAAFFDQAGYDSELNDLKKNFDQKMNQ